MVWVRLTVGLNVVFYPEDVNKFGERSDEWIGTRKQMAMTNIDRACIIVGRGRERTRKEPPFKGS